MRFRHMVAVYAVSAWHFYLINGSSASMDALIHQTQTDLHSATDELPVLVSSSYHLVGPPCTAEMARHCMLLYCTLSCSKIWQCKWFAIINRLCASEANHWIHETHWLLVYQWLTATVMARQKRHGCVNNDYLPQDVGRLYMFRTTP